jgi:mannose-6-phosphate isomerase-like protein (cupin superfamily)
MMKSQKYSPQETNKIDLRTKVIFKYPTPIKEMDIAKMIINGRNPDSPGTFILEHGCDFVIYVLKGRGKVYAGEEIFSVRTGDVVFIPKENKFAMEGDFEYITVDSPAYYSEQAEEVKGN